MHGAFVAGASRGAASENDLLNEAAMLTAMRRAGLVPLEGDEAPITVNGTDDLPPLSAGLEDLRLALTLSGRLAIEWCREAALRGWRVPDAALPALLDEMAKVPDGWRDALPALGRRGLWLASLNPAWQGVAQRRSATSREEALERWSEATLGERKSLLKGVAQDRESSLALVQSTWKSDTAKVRVGLVETFAEGVQPQDAEFLLLCLEDRSLEVRYAAAVGLMRLGEASYAKEVGDLAREFMETEPSVKVEAPQGDDKRLERYGIAAFKGAADVRQRQERLTRLVSVVPPSAWISDVPEKPASGFMGIVRRVFSGDSPDPLRTFIRKVPLGNEGHAFRRGLMEAVAHAADPDWATAIAEETWQGWSGWFGGIIPLISRPNQEKLAKEAWQPMAKTHGSAFFDFAISDKPWSPEFTRWFITTVLSAPVAPDMRYYPSFAREAAYLMDPDAAEFPREIPELWEDVVLHWARILDLRRSIRRTFRETPKP